MITPTTSANSHPRIYRDLSAVVRNLQQRDARVLGLNTELRADSDTADFTLAMIGALKKYVGVSRDALASFLIRRNGMKTRASGTPATLIAVHTIW